MATEAGRGEHRVYRIVPKVPDGAVPLTAGKHYLGVDAVAWYINKESSWFSDRMASGTLQITLSSGLEKYQAALGTFELKSGAKTAPVFEQPVLPDRNFNGGPIQLNASLTAIKSDTVLAGMLKSAASASIGIVAGMVQTASLAGPAQLLSAAGNDLVNGVRRVLDDVAEKREPLFDFSGLQYALRPTLLVGPEIFLLLHRGAPLDEQQLTVRPSGQLLLPFFGETVLDDGAWLLLRLRRSDEYTGVRDWYTKARELRGKLAGVVSDVVETGAISKNDGLKRLRPSSTGDSTLFDEFVKLRAIIQNDGVLSEREAGLHVGQLSAAIGAARKAITSHTSEAFFDLTAKLNLSLATGESSGGTVEKAFIDEVRGLSYSRGGKLAVQIGGLQPQAVFETMQYIPGAINRSGDKW